MGSSRWDDPQVTPEAVGVTGKTQAAVLAQVLTVNQPTYAGPPVLPARIEKTRDHWYDTPGVEFYVDFEFCSDLNDDCSTLPEKGGQPLIFLIGCGHLENGAWQFTSWGTHTLSEEEELRIIRDWVAHMFVVRDRLDSAEQPAADFSTGRPPNRRRWKTPINRPERDTGSTPTGPH